jgi:hypothetical protein
VKASFAPSLESRTDDSTEYEASSPVSPTKKKRLDKLREIKKEKMKIENLPDWNTHGTTKPQKKYVKMSERSVPVSNM